MVICPFFDKNLSVKSVSDRYTFYLFIIHVYVMINAAQFEGEIVGERTTKYI